uniref:LysR substrate-binding domain-containing protein n=1 Tax=Thaumasiovibrio occultus TaxID=1891184 RepID=UPI000B356A64|nr:LysR substrate-binding domain-containing protein [Thaumasiovibrio occultus]
MNLTLRQLQVFVSVASHGSITQAAETLFITKPAVSMALAELEKQLGHPLFDRQKNRLYLNHQGNTLLPYANELLQRSDAIASLFSQESRLTGNLAIGCSDTVGNHLAPPLLKAFRDKTGHLQQSLHISNTRKICQQLIDFELDIGLVEGHVASPDLVAIPWRGDNMIVACASGDPLAKSRTIQLSDLEDQQWLLREKGSGTRAFFLEHIGTKLSRWHLAFELNNTEALINACAAELGLICLSKIALQHALDDGRLHFLYQMDHSQRTFHLVYHKQKYQSPLIQAFIEFCHQWQP